MKKIKEIKVTDTFLIKKVSVTFIFICMALGGCSSLTTNQMAGSFVEPQYGMTRLQLVNSLGKPQEIEDYRKTDQSKVEYYIYIRKYQSSEEKVPVCLVNNKVVGWGKTFYEDHVSSDDTRIK